MNYYYFNEKTHPDYRVKIRNGRISYVRIRPCSFAERFIDSFARIVILLCAYLRNSTNLFIRFIVEKTQSNPKEVDENNNVINQEFKLEGLVDLRQLKNVNESVPFSRKGLVDNTSLHNDHLLINEAKRKRKLNFLCRDDDINYQEVSKAPIFLCADYYNRESEESTSEESASIKLDHSIDASSDVESESDKATPETNLVDSNSSNHTDELMDTSLEKIIPERKATPEKKSEFILRPFPFPFEVLDHQFNFAVDVQLDEPRTNGGCVSNDRKTFKNKLHAESECVLTSVKNGPTYPEVSLLVNYNVPGFPKSTIVRRKNYSSDTFRLNKVNLIETILNPHASVEFVEEFKWSLCELKKGEMVMVFVLCTEDSTNSEAKDHLSAYQFKIDKEKDLSPLDARVINLVVDVNGNF